MFKTHLTIENVLVARLFLKLYSGDSNMLVLHKTDIPDPKNGLKRFGGEDEPSWPAYEV